MACVCSGYNWSANSRSLFSCNVCGPAKTKQKPDNKQLINLKCFGLYAKISNLHFAILPLVSLGQYGNVSVWDFPVKNSVLVNKYV